MGVFPNIVSPVNYNDKISWLMLFDQDPLIPICMDKYKVRDFVKSRIGDEYLTKLYAVCSSFDEIETNKLPDSFVVKTNHDSGTVFLVKNKNEWNREEAKKKIDKSLSRLYGTKKGEWAYQHIEPKIIIEEYLGDLNAPPPPDFKFHCVDGTVRWLHYIYDRGEQTKEITFDRNFNVLPLYLCHEFILSTENIPTPKNWNELVSVAEKLAQGFKYVRVDLYNIDERIVFGELTFFPKAGCYKTPDITQFGQMLDFRTDDPLPPISS